MKLDGLCRSLSCTGYEGQSEDDYEEEDVYGEGRLGFLVCKPNILGSNWVYGLVFNDFFHILNIVYPYPSCDRLIFFSP